MIFLAKNINFSDIYSTKCLKKCMIKMTVPEVCKTEKSEEAEVFYSQNGVPRGFVGKCSATN
jgi:hypothetical protein